MPGILRSILLKNNWFKAELRKAEIGPRIQWAPFVALGGVVWLPVLLSPQSSLLNDNSPVLYAKSCICDDHQIFFFIELYAVDLALICISPILLSILDIQNAVAAVFDCREIKGKGGVKLCYLESGKQNYRRKEK